MLLQDYFPFLIAAAIVVVAIVVKVATMRANARRKAEGREPIPEEPKIVNVIDWTRRN